MMIALLGLLLFLYIPLRFILLGSFTQLEQQMMLTEVNRSVNALNTTYSTLNDVVGGYSYWDDSYAFVVDRTPEYAMFLNESLFANSAINVTLVVSDSGEVLLGKAFDLNTQQFVPVPAALQTFHAAEPFLLHPDINAGVYGLVMLPNGPMLLVSRPILTSAGQGPPRGSMIMGRYLDARELDRLAKSVQTTFTIHPLAAPGLAPEVVRARAALLRGVATVIEPTNEQTIDGYRLLNDVYGKPSIIVHATAPRAIYAQGQYGMQYFVLALALAGLVFGIVFLLLLEWTVLSRLARLSNDVQGITAQRNLAARVGITGNDELTRLSHAINGMMGALERSQNEHQRAAEAQEQLRLQEETIRAKRSFISVVSHELRTPLTPIRGYVDMLNAGIGGPLNHTQHEFVDAIRNNTLRMIALVDDLLEIGSLEANRVELHIAPTNLRAVSDSVLALLEPEIKRKQMTIIQDFDEQLPYVDADAKRIEQVLTNLVSNAVKYTYPGGSIRINAATSNGDVVYVEVADTGVGLTEEQQQRLFEPFYRADNPLRDLVKGTGLGLSIARAFVELHGGQMSVRSTSGVGSTFTFILPIHQPVHSSP